MRPTSDGGPWWCGGGSSGCWARAGEMQSAAPTAVCMACRLGQWRAASRHACASNGVDGSPPPTPTGGGRSSTGRRRDRRPPCLSHEGQQAEASQRVVDHRGASRQIFTANASIASPPCIGWQPASCLNDVCGAGDFDTLRATASGQGDWALGARAMQEPWVASRNALFVAPITPAPLGRRTMTVRKTLVGSSRAAPFLPSAVADAEGGGGAEDGGVTGGR